MTTTLDLIERTRRHLYSGETRDERDRLSAAITSGATGLGITYGRASVQPGATLGIDLEELYVWDVSGTNVAVSRGEGGSTAAAHDNAAVIHVNPRFSAYSVLQAINDELLALASAGLYRIRTVALTYQGGTDAYNLTGVTDVIDVLGVDFDYDDGSGRWSTLPRSMWNLRRDMPTATFASGLSLTVNGVVAYGQAVRVAYKAPYATLATLVDDVETVSGLQASAHDIVPLGAAIRLTVGSEVARNSLDQYDTRRADEVPAGARLGQMRAMAALRAQRIADEAARLYALRPVIRG